LTTPISGSRFALNVELSLRKNEENSMKRHGCLIGGICIILSPILFFVGILASVYPGSILEGPVNWFIFWLFTVLSFVLFIIGSVFIIIRLIQKRAELVLDKDEIIEHRTISCAKCNTEVSEGDKTCPSCGAEFEADIVKITYCVE
jgi:hypothetical protein